MYDKALSQQLVRSSMSAMLAAIEIYNKPRIDHRDENCIVLLVNAWEMLLKALLCKHNQPIFYMAASRQKAEPRTLSLRQVLKQSMDLLPEQMAVLPVQRNLELLMEYRNSAIHFLVAVDEVAPLLYVLAQASIANYNDLLRLEFGEDLSQDITWAALPLALRAPDQPTEFIGGKTISSPERSDLPAVREFAQKLVAAIDEVEQSHGASSSGFLVMSPPESREQAGPT